MIENKTPKISLAIPYHDAPHTAFFLSRILKSIHEQSFKDYEIVLLKKGRMGETYNECIRRSKGEYIKLMGIDDYFYQPDSLAEIVTGFEQCPQAWWLASACLHDDGINVGHLHTPSWNDNLYAGYNTIGGFACVTIRNKDVPPISEDLDWIVDVDWYWRIFQQHGLPYVITKPNVVVGVGLHQTTHTLSQEQKEKEWEYGRNKYGK